MKKLLILPFLFVNCILVTATETTHNMYPNLPLKDQAMFLRYPLTFKRGDIVTFKPIVDNIELRKIYPSRILGLPGEEIEVSTTEIEIDEKFKLEIPTVIINQNVPSIKIHEEQNKVIIFTETWSDFQNRISYKIETKMDRINKKFKLSENEYFVMNDYRSFPSSHVFPYGIIDQKQIKWKYLFTYWKMNFSPNTID